jgi:peptidoglycan hydrolase CwlO-like protein
VNTLSTQIVQLNEDMAALSNRIESLNRKIDSRTEHLA